MSVCGEVCQPTKEKARAGTIGKTHHRGELIFQDLNHNVTCVVASNHICIIIMSISLEL